MHTNRIEMKIGNASFRIYGSNNVYFYSRGSKPNSRARIPPCLSSLGLLPPLHRLLYVPPLLLHQFSSLLLLPISLFSALAPPLSSLPFFHVGLFPSLPFTASLIRKYEGHSDYVHCLAMKDDDLLLSGSEDGSLRFWDPRSSGSCVAIMG